jgi:hypothetical protein
LYPFDHLLDQQAVRIQITLKLFPLKKLVNMKNITNGKSEKCRSKTVDNQMASSYLSFSYPESQFKMSEIGRGK